MRDWTYYACGWKPVFNYTIGGLTKALTDSSLVSSMYLSRAFLAPAWFAIIFAWLRSRRPIAPLICYLGSSAFFIETSVIRTDVAALPFLLWHFVLVSDRLPESASDKQRIKRLIALIATAVAAILITPKSGLILGCFAPFYFSTINRVRVRWSAKQIIAAVLAGAVTLLAMTTVLDVAQTSQFFMNLFVPEDYGARYWDLLRFQYLFRIFDENPQMLILLLAWLIILLRDLVVERWKTWRRWPARAASAWTAGSAFALMVFFPDKLPFFLACMLALFTFAIAREFDADAHPRAARVARWLAGFAVLNGIHWAAQIPAIYNNAKQVEMSRKLDSVVRTLPHLRIYDGIGLATTEELFNEYLGPGDYQQNLRSLERIRSKEFDVIVLTNKLNVFREVLEGDLQRSYIEAKPDLFVRAADRAFIYPKKPVPELQDLLHASFAKWLGPEALITVFALDKERGFWEIIGGHPFKYSEIDKLGPLCSDCEDMTISVTPFGGFFELSMPAPFSVEYKFEPETPRLGLLPTIGKIFF